MEKTRGGINTSARIEIMIRNLPVCAIYYRVSTKPNVIQTFKHAAFIPPYNGNISTNEHVPRNISSLGVCHAHKIPISSGTKSIRHARLSRGEYYQRVNDNGGSTNRYGRSEIYNFAFVTFDKPTRRMRRPLRNRRSKNVALQWQRERKREKRIPSFGIPPSLYSSALLRRDSRKS